MDIQFTKGALCVRIPLSKDQYASFSNRLTPRSPLLRDVSLAFLFGGSICLIGQCFLSLYLSLGLGEKTGAALTSVSLIFLGSLLSALNIYPKLAKYGGAGTLVPITGFSNSMTSAAIEFKSEGLVTGLGAKMFVIAGPVIVYGISASILYGIIYYLVGRMSL